jgi:hypothetical protein
MLPLAAQRALDVLLVPVVVAAEPEEEVAELACTQGGFPHRHLQPSIFPQVQCLQVQDPACCRGEHQTKAVAGPRYACHRGSTSTWCTSSSHWLDLASHCCWHEIREKLLRFDDWCLCGCVSVCCLPLGLTQTQKLHQTTPHHTTPHRTSAHHSTPHHTIKANIKQDHANITTSKTAKHHQHADIVFEKSKATSTNTLPNPTRLSRNHVKEPS